LIVATAFLSVVGLVFLYRSIALPLGRLNTAVAAFAAGDRTVRVNRFARNEIGRGMPSFQCDGG